MTAIGSLMFCNDCGNLLEANTNVKKTILTCDVCGTTCRDVSAKVIMTKSKPSDFPSELRSRRAQVQTVNEDEMQTEAKTQTTCEKCGVPEVNYHEKQTRGADEGSTIFYTCPSCGHKWNTNN